MDLATKFRVKPGSKVKLSRIDTGVSGKQDKAAAIVQLAHEGKRLTELQRLLYAENKRSLLIVLQGMDASGKDGTVNQALAALNPLGTKVWAFKVPSTEELGHDFLWRIHRRAPARGEIAVFNRSHYEDVLATRVLKLVPEDTWKRRYRHILDFERMLVENGTTILKFFLHISPDEQLKRLQRRLDDPTRQWKLTESDYTDRKLWPQYEAAYEEAIETTTTRQAPWFVIPADAKWFRNLVVCKIVVEALEAMDLKPPSPTADLAAIRRKYHPGEAKPRRRRA